MSLLHDAIATKKFDTRMIERNLQRGQVSAEEVEKAVKALPDDSENVHQVTSDDLAFQEELSRRSR